MVALVLLKTKIGQAKFSVLKIGIPMSKTTPLSTPYLTPIIMYIHIYIYVYVYLCIFIYICFKTFAKNAKNLLIHPAPGTISSPNKG